MFDDYEQGERIGSGGFADVFRALHVPTGRAYALKLGRDDEESVARIHREIEVQRKLAHAKD
jgi:serine/threonine protein kinase